MKITKNKLRKLIKEALTDLELSAAEEAQKELELRFPDMDFSETEAIADKLGSHADDWESKSKLAINAARMWEDKFQPNLKGVIAYASGAPSMFAEAPPELVRLISAAAEAAPDWAKSTEKYRQIYDLYSMHVDKTPRDFLEPTQQIDKFDHESMMNRKRDSFSRNSPVDIEKLEKEIEDKNRLELDQGLTMVDDELKALNLKRRKKRHMMSKKI